MNGLVIDLFAGGGGASQGIEAALGRPVDIAINHDVVALAVHKANHPETRHVEEDIWRANPGELVQGRPVALLWASPDCTHFSTAKGGKPRKKKLRTLAWAVYRWARATKPGVIFLENVKEFEGWGPLTKECKPDKRYIGKTFRCWIRRIERLGYVVEYRMLDASLYGAPTRRRRLFIVARRDGKPIGWPEFTHGPGRLPLRTAAECIDWSLACPSIFERKRDLRPKTLWRIAQGVKRFVLDNPRPFIVGVGGRAGQSDPTPLDAPVGTITAKNDRGLVAPHLVKVNHGKDDPRGESLQQPLSTVTAERRGHALVAPHLVKFRGEAHSSSLEEPMPTITAGPKEQPAGAAHALGLATSLLVEMNHSNAPQSVERPLGVVTSQHNRFNLVAPHLIKVNHGDDAKTGPREHSLEKPLTTVSAENGHALIAPALVQMSYGEDTKRAGGAGQPARVLDLGQPLGTVVAGGVKHGLVSAFLAKHYGGVVGQQLDFQLGTITARDHHSLAAAHLVKLRGQCHSAGMDEPVPTLSAQGTHVAEVCAFLLKYYGTARAGQQLDIPLHTLTSKDRLGLVVVEGVQYAIADIGMRMLQPHELLRAQFGRFAATTDLSAAKTKSEMVRLIGNSVCPEVAEALVAANLPDRALQEAA